MTTFMTYALIAFMVGVVIKRFINPQVGDTVEVVAAILIVLAWLLTYIR